MLAYFGCIILGASIGLFLAALAAANRLSELRDEVHELRRRLSECTCKAGA